MELWLNGKSLGKSPDWPRPIELDVSKAIAQGKNQIAVTGQNAGGIAAYVFKAVIEYKDGSKDSIVSDKSWKLSKEEAPNWNQASFDDSKWTSPKLVNKLGAQPWRIPNYSTAPVKSSGGNKLAAKNIMVPPGFIVDHIYTVPKATEGSWVSLTTDDKGRLYACDQGRAGLFRITVKEGESPLVEKVSTGELAGISGAQGLLWAFDSLWFHRNGGNLYRLTDTNGDDKLDKAEVIPGGTGGGEHGNHGVILTEDGTGIYMNGGNHAPLGEYKSSRVTTWEEDLLLPRMWDARGHARGRLAPGGWVTRLNPKTFEQTVYTIGFRNEYDISLNRFGDIFTYDADMEWDMGMPWYRPTRICHAASGADFGWRSGSGKWPAYYEDSVPPVVDIGPGSPTGVVSGAGTQFPTHYQDAIYGLDWTFGTIYAIHLKPNGASYTGKAEPFVYSSPLPVTDAVVGKDGALYFTVGGRGTDSVMYRVRYIGDESIAAPTHIDPKNAAARALRRKLETFHGQVKADAIEQAWPHLGSSDRFIRNAARVAIESQPAKAWAPRVFNEANMQARITAAVALARSSDATHHAALVKSLLEIDPANLSEGELLGLLRAYALTFIRLGRPTGEERIAVIAQLDPLLPSKSANVNTELIRVLTYLQAKSVIAKTMALIENRKAPELPNWSELASRNARYGGTVIKMLDNHPPSTEINYAFMLQNMRTGWTIDQRRAYFTFLNEAAKGSGGASFPGFLTRIREEALASCSNAERKLLEDITGEDFNPVPDFEITKPQGPGKNYTVETAKGAVRGKPNFERGRSLFFSAKCADCHRLRGLGGTIGPDLTSVPNKFNQDYVIEAIVEPSKHISDQYGSTVVLLDSGKVITGLVVEGGDKLTIYPNEPNSKPVEVSLDEVEAMQPSPVSQMPKELLNTLSPEEVRDLVNYVMSAGNSGDKRYQK